jgi:hypothetical protein
VVQPVNGGGRGENYRDAAVECATPGLIPIISRGNLAMSVCRAGYRAGQGKYIIYEVGDMTKLKLNEEDRSATRE